MADDKTATKAKPTAKASKHKPLADNVVAIASGKGGVGKTWLSSTLAHSIARSGRSVLLFDGDIGLANIDVQLGLTPDRDLNTYFTGKAPLEKIPIHYHLGGFDIIAGRSGSGVLASLPVPRLAAFARDMRQLARSYELILLDLGAGVEQHVRFLTGLAARCVVVLTEDPTSLTDAYAFIKLCRRQHPNTEIQIVVNQASSQREGEKTYQAIKTACQNFLNFEPKLMGIIRKDNKVRDAIRAQAPLITRSPNCTAATDVASLSVKLLAKKT